MTSTVFPAPTAAEFRADFPEFASLSAYSNGQVNFWLTVAGKLISDLRWKDLYPQAVGLFVAHNLALGDQSKKAAQRGGTPGLARGAISAESVSQASVSYDTSASMEENAGHWNLTTYGQRYIHLARLFGSGPIQVSGHVRNPVPFSGVAWPGPFYWAGD